MFPPGSLLAACAPSKVARPSTYRDVALSLHTDLANCDADKTALREWATKTKDNYGSTK